MFKSIPQVQTGDRNTNQMQSNIISPLNQLFKNPIIAGQYFDTHEDESGRIVPGYVLDAGDNIVRHNLGYKPTGCIVCTQNAAASFYYPALSKDDDPNKILIINSSGSVTVTLYVF